MARVDIGSQADFAEGLGALVTIGTRRLAVFRVGNQFFAIDDACPHRGFPLNDGTVSGTILRCRNHGACFDLETGTVVRGPATSGVRTYPVRVDGNRVAIEIDL